MGATLDQLIYDALYSVDLHTHFFAEKDKHDELNNVFRSAVRYTLNKFRGWWAQRQETLVQDPGIDTGWYRAPADLISWLRPLPYRTAYDKMSRPIYQLESKTIVYIYDRNDLSNCPPPVLEYIKFYFLWLLSAKQTFNPLQVSRIDTMLSILGNELAKFTQEASLKRRRNYNNNICLDNFIWI